jgi:beta-lactam-binding protein with PASTA domain
MDIKKFFTDSSIGGLLKNLAVIAGIVLFFGVVYFYIYLPNITRHGESIEVPELRGVNVNELEKFLKEHKLRYSVNDSAYTDSLPPLSVLRQFPLPGSKVKESRIVYVSLNRVSPTTTPLPDLIDGSLINAKAVLKSNELKLGRVYYEASPFPLVRELRYKGKVIMVGERLPKGSVIDLVVGDGFGPADFVIGDVLGDDYETALRKLSGWNLHLGNVEIMPGADTTGVTPFVFKQYPLSGDSVRVGDPVDLWLAPKGYKEPEKVNEENQ